MFKMGLCTPNICSLIDKKEYISVTKLRFVTIFVGYGNTGCRVFKRRVQNNRILELVDQTFSISLSSRLNFDLNRLRYVMLLKMHIEDDKKVRSLELLSRHQNTF